MEEDEEDKVESPRLVKKLKTETNGSESTAEKEEET